MPVKIELVLDEFVEVVKKKLRKKQRQGYAGWDSLYYKPGIRLQLVKNIKDRDWVDVAALSMMLWNLERMKSE